MMGKPQTGSHAPNSVQFSYQLIRNVTSPDEKSVGVQTFIANLGAGEILKIGTQGNLRGYLAEYNPKKRNSVHDAISKTIEEVPERFIVRNSGFVITASDVKIDEDRKLITLRHANIINGAQSQGEIRRYFEDITDPDNPESPSEIPFYVRATIIVDDDPTEVVETAIARNIVTPVKSLSEAGARSQLEELEASIQKVFPAAKIRKNESHHGEDYLDTRMILQLARLLMPTSVSGNSSPSEKLRAYKNPEQCLTDFCDWQADQDDPVKKAKYDFTVQIAPHALKEYRLWQSHPGWNGQKIWEETKKGRAVRRDSKTRQIIWVSPGILFPLIGALSEFPVKGKDGSWRLVKPSIFSEANMIERAVGQFRAHDSDPMAMGRDEAAYDALRIYPSTLMQVLQNVEGSTQKK